MNRLTFLSVGTAWTSPIAELHPAESEPTSRNNSKGCSRRSAISLRGGLWALRGNAWTRNSEQPQRRSQLMAAYPALGRAVVLREFLQDALAGSDRAQLEGWLAWAQRSRLAPFRDLARTIKRHFVGVLADMQTRLTNGVMEAINGLLQLAKRIARGFRNFHYFRLAAYLKAGGLNLQTPRLLPI